MIPLFWIAAALAVGIALGGLWPQAPLAWLVLALSSVVVGLLFVRRRRLRSAAAAALRARGRSPRLARGRPPPRL